MATGLLILQLAWVFVVPPFRNADEFDHAYRAASVARGEWRPESTSATRGTGAFVTVPDDVVAAAGPECRRLPYTFPHDCTGTQTAEGTVVSSGAGRYHPAFYAVTGTVAMPFDGASALYAMRIAALLLCWGFIVAALRSLDRWARTSWPFIGLVVASSPMVVFNTSTASPNGLEIAAAIALWASGAGIVRAKETIPLGLLVTATVAAVVLVTVRSLGPLWALLIVTGLVLAQPRPVDLVRGLARRPNVRAAFAVVVTATLASLAWIVSASSLVIGTLKVPEVVSQYGPLVMYARTVLLWMLQSIGAFPYRDQGALPVVYALYLVPLVWLVGVALARGNRRAVTALVGVAVLSVVIPLAITAATIERHGLSWNGGYTLPFSIGFLFLAGSALDDTLPSPSFPSALPVGLAHALAHTLAPLGVLREELSGSPGVGDGSWVLLPFPAVVLAVVAGSALVWSGASRGTHPLHPGPPALGHRGVSREPDEIEPGAAFRKPTHGGSGEVQSHH